MDVLLPEDPQEERTNTPTMEGETVSGDSLSHATSSSQEQHKDGERKEGRGKEGKLDAEAKQTGESGEGANAQASKGKHASGRKPRTKGLIKKLQEQVNGNGECEIVFI